MSLSIRNVTTVSEGDGVDVKRLFPLSDFMNFDPFVLCDHFNISAGRGFSDHPHRGFEAITYMLEGGMNHRDNLGNASFVRAGGAQRFTAGSGLVHSEMPAEQGQSNGLQIWINLPAKLKTVEPEYQQVDAEAFPVETIQGGQVKEIVGEHSPLKLKTPVIYQHITLNESAYYTMALAPGMRGPVYIIQGRVSVNNEVVESDQAVFVDQETDLVFMALSDSQFIICIGRPHGEPIHQHGPFVD